ncbi:MAG: hypothetical protein ACI867_000823 [Glaciecola sp.]|jgi:hypothetical protein
MKAASLSAAGAAAVAGAPAGSRLARVMGTPGSSAADAPGVGLARIGAVQGDARLAVIARLDATHRVFPDGSTEFLLWPGDAARLDQAGVSYQMLDHDILGGMRLNAGRRVGPQPGQRDNGYRFWDDFEADLRALAEQYPDKARLLELNSSSLLGRSIYGIEIASDVTKRDGRPVVHMDGMHHSREWPAAEMPIMWAHDLLQSYGSDADMTDIVDNVRTVIIPNNNPDGFIRSRSSIVQTDSSDGLAGTGPTLVNSIAGQEAYWRKNLRSYTGQNYSLPDVGEYHYDNVDAYGVDLNRNYGFLWGDNLGASGDRNSQTHYGQAPFSEPEVANIQDLFLEHAPITAITHHTSGKSMLFPWGRDPNLVKSPDYDALLFLGEDMNLFNGYTPKQAYGLYPTAGTSRDWGHYITRTLIYTFEHGSEFHGPYDDTIPEMYEINRGAFILHSQAAMDQDNQVVVTGRVVNAAGNPVAAKVRAHKSVLTPSAPLETGSGTIDDDPNDNNVNTLPEGDRIMTPETVNTHLFVEADGSFSFHLPPSTRPHLFEQEFGGPDLREPWEIIIEGANGGTVTIPVFGERGEQANLGTITI